MVLQGSFQNIQLASLRHALKYGPGRKVLRTAVQGA